jgi:hypothetical protein
MKRLKFNIILALIGFMPAIIQAQEVNDEAIENELKLQKSEIPEKVANSIVNSFTYEEPVQWSVFPELIRTYGGEKNTTKVSDFDLENYYVKLKTSNGSTYEAIYSKDGELIKWSEKLKNERLPFYISAALLKNEYNDWRVVSDANYINATKGNVTKQYAVKLQKGGEKKTLYFDERGELLTSK